MPVKTRSKIKAYDPLTAGIGMAQQGLENEVSIPNQHDEDARLFADIREAAGPKPRGAAALVAGVARGFEYGARSQSTAKKQEALEKYNRVMDYFQAENNRAMEMKKWYETREFAQKKYLPQVLAYAENITKLDPQSQRSMAQNILEGWNRTTGDDYKLNSIDGSDPYVMTITGKNGAQVVDIRDMFAGDELTQKRLAMTMPQYQEELQDKRRKLALEEDKVEAYKFEKGVPSRYGQKGAGGGGVETFEYNGHQYDTVPLSGREKGEITDYGKNVNKAVSQIKTNENALQSINNMREVFKRNPNIGESWINMLSSGEGEDTWGRWISKKFASRQERADMEILKKASNDLNLSTVLSVPGKSATDLLKRAIQAASPTGTLTKQGFDKIANEWEGRATDNIDLAQAQARARAQGKMILSKSNMGSSQGSFRNGGVETQQSQAAIPNDLITVRDPNTGEQDRISPKDLDAAIALGLEQVGEINAD